MNSKAELRSIEADLIKRGLLKKDWVRRMIIEEAFAPNGSPPSKLGSAIDKSAFFSVLCKLHNVLKAINNPPAAIYAITNMHDLPDLCQHRNWP